MTNQAVAELIARSNRLGSDSQEHELCRRHRRRGTETDPVTVSRLSCRGEGFLRPGGRSPACCAAA